MNQIVLCRLHGVVNEKMHRKLSIAIKRAYKYKLPLLLHINSIGGEMLWAIKMHELLVECKDGGIETIAIGYKQVHSAALLPFLTCIYRTAYYETNFLIHRSRPILGENIKDHIIGEREFFEYFAKITDVTVTEYFDLANADTFLKYPEALQKKILNFDLKKKTLAI